MVTGTDLEHKNRQQNALGMQILPKVLAPGSFFALLGTYLSQLIKLGHLFRLLTLPKVVGQWVCNYW